MQWKTWFLKQDLMRRVLYSLLPILAFSIYLFGWRVLLLSAVVTVFGVATEYVVIKKWYDGKFKVSEAVLVSCLLFALTLPPAVPFWVAVLGIIFGIFFGKGIFGGFGKNVFNPAILGRCFIYISFPASMTNLWTEPFAGFPGGLIRYAGGVDSVTTATPLGSIPVGTQILDRVLGTIPGSAGETSALLIVAAAFYLVVTKTASWKIIVSTVVGFLALGLVVFGVGSMNLNPFTALISGGFLFGAVFMATDPISAPRSDTAKVLYGLLIGVLTIIVRAYGNFTEGIMFAILIANTFAPFLDRQVKEYEAGKKAKLAAVGEKVAS